jgi:hypothetical protein
MVNANIDIFEMSYDESVSYFKLLENLEKIRRTNSPGPATVPVYDQKSVSVSSSVAKSSKNPKVSNIYCHYCPRITTPRLQSQETRVFFWTFHVDDRSESSSTYDTIIGNEMRTSWLIRHNHELQ